jgi:hypothetical protein
LGTIDIFRLSGSAQNAEGLLGEIRLYTKSTVASANF